MRKDKNGSWTYLTQLSVNYLGWAFCWTATSAYMVPNTLLRMVDDTVKNSRLGLMTGTANILVIILIPLIGTLSDRATFRFGKRRPFYLVATFAVCLFAILMVECNSFAFLWLLVVLMHGALAAWFPARALVRDIVPLKKRGRISGLTNITNTLGIMSAHIVASRFIEADKMMRLALIVVTANIFANLWVALVIKEKPPDREIDQEPFSLREVYIPRLEKAQGLGSLAAANFVTYMGIVAMTCFLLFFIRDQVDFEHFNVTFGKVVLIAMGAAIPSSIGAGFLADRFGRKNVYLWACVLQIACMINFLLSPRVHSTLYLSGLLYGLGNGAYLSMYWTILSDLVPEDEASKYIGLMQYTMQIPWAITPIALGPIVDNFGAASGRGYNILFSIITVFLVIGMILIRKIPETLKGEEPDMVEENS